MNILRRELKTLLFIIIVTGISLVILTQKNNRFGERVFSATPPAIPTLMPTAVPVDPVQTVTIDSPDGLKTLTMQKQKTGNRIAYSFLTATKSDAKKQPLFSKTENVPDDFTIPYNTWSPDNAYVFLKETVTAADNYYIFHSNGVPFPDGSQYLNIQDLFKQKLPDYILSDITGWAAPDLLIVNTKTEQGEKGPSFWFIVSSQSFEQLGTYFN